MATSRRSQRDNGSLFAVDHARLNPHFEAYKLDTSDYQVKHYRLPSRISAFALSSELGTDGRSTQPVLNYRELKDRFSQEKLVPGSHRGQLAFIDDAGFLILIELSKRGKPSFHPLHNIRSSSTAQGETDQRLESECMPSVCSLTNGRWLVADGRGSLQLISTSKIPSAKRWTAEVDASFTVHDRDVQQPLGLRILDAQVIPDSSIILVLVQSSRRVPVYSDSLPTSRTIKPSTKTVFDVSLLHLDAATSSVAGTLDQALSTDSSVVTPQWTVSGDEPVYLSQAGDSVTNSHLIVSESVFDFARLDATGGTRSQSDSDALSDRHATGEPSAKRAKAAYPDQGKRAASFSWLQSSDSVTVIFQLPGELAKSDFRIHFSPQGVSLSLTSDAACKFGPPKIAEVREGEDSPSHGQIASTYSALTDTARALAQDQFASRKLWAPIDPSASVWTWETMESGQETKGLLTLHLEKKYEETRWLHVFEKRSQSNVVDGAPSSLSTPAPPMIGGPSSVTRQSEEEKLRNHELRENMKDTSEDVFLDEDPPETVDPSELVSMLEGLEKYTVEGTGDEEAILRPSGVDGESLLHDVLEPEDANVGRRAVLTVASGSDSDATLSRYAAQKADYSLAEAIPGSQQRNALVVRQDLNGLVFVSDGQASNQKWAHVDTLPALSFVLASKRDLNRVYLYYDNNKQTSVVLAFENAPRTSSNQTGDGSSNAGQGAGNLFVYYSQQKERFARSRVIRLGVDENAPAADQEDSSSGALMGVAVAQYPLEQGDEDEKDQKVVGCLCERRVIVLDDIL
ncbi:unnamed protein product [Sympodiomycopsis kandeliae]